MTLAARPRAAPAPPYLLDEQVGFLMRQAQQRHANIFAALMVEELTPTQWAALAKLAELGPCSQNALGRHTAMDGATIKGVIDRLTARGFTVATPDPADGRRLVVALTPAGAAAFARGRPMAERITEATLEPLTAEQRAHFVALLRRLG
ncbi:MAG: MarR family transcriptional regulator [Roseiarcus sp.]|jgi:DNA-binding MarR family transcriptional regulator